MQGFIVYTERMDSDGFAAAGIRIRITVLTCFFPIVTVFIVFDSVLHRVDSDYFTATHITKISTRKHTHNIINFIIAYSNK